MAASLMFVKKSRVSDANFAPITETPLDGAYGSSPRSLADY